MATAGGGGPKELTLSNSTDWSASTAFGADYASDVEKIVIIPSGVTIGGTGSNAAITLEAGMLGTLVINNSGTIIGYGGAANSGVGGTGIKALTNSSSTITVNNLSGGNIQGGGGGGGQGGDGGNGSDGTKVIMFGMCMGVRPAKGLGGDGGAGGVGAGYNQAAGSGSTGASGTAGGAATQGQWQQPGGTGGTGGTGGNGGAIGATGSTGTTGGNGAQADISYEAYYGCGHGDLAQNGAAGSTGGLAGYYIENLAYVTLSNAGTVAGRS